MPAVNGDTVAANIAETVKITLVVDMVPFVFHRLMLDGRFPVVVGLPIAGGLPFPSARPPDGRVGESAGGRVRPRRENRFEVELKSHALPPRVGEI